jgi:hypothetical protein
LLNEYTQATGSTQQSSKQLETVYYCMSWSSFYKTQESFPTNSTIHTVNTRNKNQLHRPTASLSCFQKSAYYAGIKIFNSLPSNITTLINKQVQFKIALKRYLNTHPFYSVEEFMLLSNSKCM